MDLDLNIERPLRKYESIIIMHPDASEEDQKSLFRKNKEILKNFSGDYHHVDCWGKRKLANSIDKIKMGIYFHSSFECKAETINELERTMGINDKVFRCSHVRLDDKKALSQHLEDFREVIKQSAERDKEREAKAQARKAAGAARRGPPRERR